MTDTSLSSGPQPQSDFDSQFNRLFEAIGFITQEDLAAILEIPPSSISNAKRRGKIPASWLLTLLEKNRINPNWIRHGTGAMRLPSDDAPQTTPHIIRVIEVRPPKECSAQDLVNELVRRALQEPDIQAIRKNVTDSWQPLSPSPGKPDKPDGES